MQLSIQNQPRMTGYSGRASSKAAGTAGFSALLQTMQSQPAEVPTYHIPLRTEATIYYIGHGDGQDVLVEYAEGSTPEDPIVRIQGHSLSGEFDFTRHIRDIDLGNASYAELCALVGYQAQTEGISTGGMPGPLQAVPLGMQVGDFQQKVNYREAAAQYLAAGKCSAGIYRQGMALLRFYQSVLPKIGL